MSEASTAFLAALKKLAGNELEAATGDAERSAFLVSAMVTWTGLAIAGTSYDDPARADRLAQWAGKRIRAVVTEATPEMAAAVAAAVAASPTPGESP